MSTPKPSRGTIVRLSDLKSGERGTFFAVLAERHRGSTQTSKPFYTCRFRDARRIVSFMVWLDGGYFEECDTKWEVGQAFKIYGLFAEHHRYGPQIEVEKIRPVVDRDAADGFDLSQLIERPKFDAPALLADLRTLAEMHLVDDPLRRLVIGLLDQHAEKLIALPADPRRYFPYPGGWVAHTLSVTRSVVWLVEKYREQFTELSPPLNKDAAVAGAILHEIGRVAELTPASQLAEPAEQTIDGRLFGHLFLGRDLVRDAARLQGDVNPALLQLVEHVLVAHLNHPEWGSPRLALIPEVLIVHHADDLDAKMEMFVRCLTRDASPTLFTERDPILNRALFKGREL